MTTTANVLPATRQSARRGRAAKSSPPANVVSTPNDRPPGATSPSPPAIRGAPTVVDARAGINPSPPASQKPTPVSPAPVANDLPSQHTSDDQAARAGDAPPTPTVRLPVSNPDPSGWVELRLYAEIFDDLQKARIRFENQIRSATVDPAFAAGHLDRLAKSEREAAKILKRTLKHAAPHLYAWAQDTRGVGEHTLARLLGSTGNPHIATPHHWQGEGADRILVADEQYARNVAKLWAYCGCGDPDRKRRKGMTADDGAALGNPRAKTAVYLMAVAQLKSNGAYRDVYDERRLATADRGWTAGHSHSDALRIVGKELLKAIWRAA